MKEQLETNQIAKKTIPTPPVEPPLERPLSVSVRSRAQRAGTQFYTQLALDALLINVAFLLSYYLRYVLQKDTLFIGDGRFYDVPLSFYVPLEIGITLALLLLFYVKGLYRIHPTGLYARQLAKIASSTTTGFAIIIAIQYMFKPLANSRGLIIYAWLSIIALVFVGKLLTGALLTYRFRKGIGVTRMLVVGSGRLGKMIMQHIAAQPNLGYKIVGFVDGLDGPVSDFGRFRAVGTMDKLAEVVERERIDEVLIALPSRFHEEIKMAVALCETSGTAFRLLPDLFDMSLSRIDMDSIEGIPLISIKEATLSSSNRLLKRASDIFLSGLALVLTAPIWLMIALAIRLDSEGSILLRQERLGYKGKPFTILKFRSMCRNADSLLSQVAALNETKGVTFKAKNDPRITAVGRFLRRTSLDELPQFWNVLRGDMSLVGPRPPLASEVARYEEWQRARLNVAPGITGLWQVRGRSELSFDEMVLLDLYYIEGWSLKLDVQILLRTIPAVLLSKGAY